MNEPNDRTTEQADETRSAGNEENEPATRSQMEQRWGETAAERRSSLEFLDDLKEQMDDRIKDIDDHMVKTSDQATLNELREHRLELERQRSRIVDEIRNIEVADNSTFTTVRENANSVARDVGQWFERQGERIEELFDGDGNATPSEGELEEEME